MTKTRLGMSREVGVSKHTIYAWKAKYGGMDVSQAQEAKQLRDENTKLRKLVTDPSLEQEALQSEEFVVFLRERKQGGRSISEGSSQPELQTNKYHYPPPALSRSNGRTSKRPHVGGMISQLSLQCRQRVWGGNMLCMSPLGWR